MKLLKSMIILLAVLYSFSIIEFEVFASSSVGVSDIDSQITPDSSEKKISQLQKLFTGLGLYKGVIDGNYKSIEKTIIDYQINSGLISNSSDRGAGYFGKKTIVQLKKDYPEIFEKLANQHISIEKPGIGDRTFVVTAYYSPLPGQEKYSFNVYRNRYRTYEEEIRLQGDGKTTASGKGVFAGLLAAPKNYDFGTKIELDGIGIGVVEDRGGAIVNSGERGYEYDRIDIWMGYGDEGLERAKKWGKREVKGKIVSSDTLIGVEFDVSPVSKYNKLTVDAEKPKEENVVKLQKLMSEVGLYNGTTNGNFDEIKDELISFQISNKIIDSKNSDEAGYFGEKTLAVMRKKFGGGIFKIPENIVYLSLKKKQELQKIKRILLAYIVKESDGNKLMEYKYKQNIKNSLNKYIVKISSKTKKQELRFLKDIL